MQDGFVRSCPELAQQGSAAAQGLHDDERVVGREGVGEIEDLAARRESLLEERAGWEKDWKILVRHFLPRKCRLERDGDQSTQGGLRGGVLDSTGILAMRDLAAGHPGARLLICGSLYLAGTVLRENG